MSGNGPIVKRKLPIGIQNFREIRGEGYYYADKTRHIGGLIERGKHYFLSRPRRFGKSLLLDTIKELFEGSENLFHGLHIHGPGQWDWRRRHPVVRLDFGAGNFTVGGAAETCAADLLDAQAGRHGIKLDARSHGGRFEQLLRALHEAAGERVVVLVDEYDKPILDALGEPEIARANRYFLRGLYGVIKTCDAHIQFTMLTGVSNFSKVKLFSGLNNLIDITLDPRYATICGYTEADLDSVFAPEMEGLEREQVRDWYNGYNWRGEERVYNPFDILLLFDRREFGAWWFETGTPTFLVDTLVQRGVNSFSIDGMPADDELLSNFDVDEIATEALLFQTGYLTIAQAIERTGSIGYRLAYPNREVRQSLNNALRKRFLGDAASAGDVNDLHRCFREHDLAGMEERFRSIYAGIPADWHRRNNIKRFEGYYASVFYACLAVLGLDLRVEDASAAGRVDLALRCAGRVYLFEFKLLERASAGAALRQLSERGYAEKYRAAGEPIHLIGVEFSEASRNITAFDTATA